LTTHGGLWLFGGKGIDANALVDELNDLWKFNPSLGTYGEWTWMGRRQNTLLQHEWISHPGTYGTLERLPPETFPVAARVLRHGPTAMAISGSLGAMATMPSGNEGYLNDHWEFNPSLGTYGEWAWIGRKQQISDVNWCPNCGYDGVYGTLGSPATGNTPGGRGEATSWTDSSGHLWLFGGMASMPAVMRAIFNDVWEFNPSLGTYGEWAWMGGKSSLTEFLQGTYPHQQWVWIGSGTPGTFGYARCRKYSRRPQFLLQNWTDSSGNFWLFGGYGACPQFVETVGYFDDLWEFSPSTNEWAWMGGNAGSNNGGQQGVYGTLGSPAAGNLPGSRASTTTWTDSTGTYGSLAVKAILAAQVRTVPTISMTFGNISPFPLAATPTFSVAAGTYTSTRR